VTLGTVSRTPRIRCEAVPPVLWHAKRLKNRDRLRAWALRLERRLGHNKAAVPLANKLVRITWAVVRVSLIPLFAAPHR
jgi:transposase